MNERIQELLKKSTYEILGVKQVDQKQFAELVVKECIAILDEDDGATHHRELLFTHFGVEE